MFYVYTLISSQDQQLYIGSTNNLKRRMVEHNQGKVPSTKLRRPFKLVYCEAYLSESDARRRESQLKKRGQARRQLLSRISMSILQKQT